MASTTKTYTAAGEVTSSLQARKGDKISYVLTGTFDGTIKIEKSENAGASWEEVASLTAPASDVVIADFESSNGDYRARCSAYASGSPFISLQSVDLSAAEPKAVSGAGSVPSVTGQIVAVEYGNDAVHKTVLHLNNVQVNVTSVTTGAGVGGTKIYDFPECYLHHHGSKATLSIAVGDQDDFTDGTPEGDVGLGTVSPANADALGTDATDDDFGTATAFTMSSYAASVNIPSEANGNFDGTATAKDLYLTAFVDAADIDDGATGELLFTGTVTILWSNLGDD